MAKTITSRRKAAAPAAAPAPAQTEQNAPRDGASDSEGARAPVANSTAAANGTPPAAPAPDGELIRVLVNSISPNGRRRAGIGFGPEFVDMTVSAATLALLEGDPQLVVKRG